MDSEQPGVIANKVACKKFRLVCRYKCVYLPHLTSLIGVLVDLETRRTPSAMIGADRHAAA